MDVLPVPFLLVTTRGSQDPRLGQLSREGYHKSSDNGSVPQSYPPAHPGSTHTCLQLVLGVCVWFKQIQLLKADYSDDGNKRKL